MNQPQDLLRQKPLVDQYLSRQPRPLSSYHFAAIFAWQDFFDFEFTLINQHLCIFAYQNKNSFLYLPPLGEPLDLATLKECFSAMGPSKIARVENFSVNQLPLVRGGGYNVYAKAQEYVYRKSDLIALKGNAYKSKRHDHNFFTQHFKAEFEPYEERHYQGCLALYQRWAQDRRQHSTDPVYQAMLEENARVHALAIQYYRELDLIGRVVTIDGQVAAYTFGYALDEHAFCVLFEIADAAKTGSAVYIFNCLCADTALKSFEYINAMDDFGMPNVAKAKESFHPVSKLPVYTVALSSSQFPPPCGEGQGGG